MRVRPCVGCGVPEIDLILLYWNVNRRKLLRSRLLYGFVIPIKTAAKPINPSHVDSKGGEIYNASKSVREDLYADRMGFPILFYLTKRLKLSRRI